MGDVHGVFLFWEPRLTGRRGTGRSASLGSQEMPALPHASAYAAVQSSLAS